MNQDIYFYFPKFSKITNGIVTSMLSRSEFFKKHLNHTPILLSVNYQSDYFETIQEYEQKGLISKGTKWLNMYTDLMGVHPNAHGIRSGASSIQNMHRTKNSNNEFYHTNSDHQLIIAENHSIVQLHHPVTLTKNKTTSLRYDSLGNLSIIQCFDQKSGALQTETYMHVKGYPVLIKHYVPDPIFSHTLHHVDLFGSNGQMIGSFSTLQQLITYWFSGVLQNTKNKSSIICDCALTMYPIFAAKRPNTKIYVFIHSSHLIIKPESDSLIFNDYIAWSIDNIKHIDGFIVLTKQQRQDIITDMKLQQFDSKFHEIHHILTTPIGKPLFEKRNTDLCVSVGSLIPRKKPLELARVFSQVVKVLPKAQLHFYGSGELEEELKQFITANKLQDNIKIMGFSNQITEILRKSALLLSTSDTEGFPMSILEALRNGLPTIAYDCKYGPAEAIRDGFSGYIIRMGNQIDFQNAIIKLLSDPVRLMQFSDNAYSQKNLFDINQYKLKWLNLLGENVL